MAFTYGTVTGTILLPGEDSPPAKGVIYVRPEAIVLLGEEVVVPREMSVELDNTGSFSWSGIASDSPDITPQGFTYSMRIKVPGVKLAPFSFLLPTGVTLELEEIIPVLASPGVIITRGPKGDPGPAGGEASVVEHIQTTPAATWIIPIPSFTRLPTVDVYVSDERVITDVFFTTTQVTITFAVPTAGKAILT